MRENFERILKGYNEQIKGDIEELSSKERLLHMEKTERELKTGAQVRNNSVETQAKVFGLQRQKEKLMQELHESFRAIEKNKAIEAGPNARIISYNSKDDFLFFTEDGRTNVLSREAILTDGDWGIHYGFDETVPIHVQKEYVLSETKRKMHEMLDEQIIVDEKERGNISLPMKKVYEKVYENKIEGKTKEEIQNGFLAEKMIKGLFNQIALGGAPFVLEESDAYQDITQKIDFILKVKHSDHARGIKAEADAKAIGIQFTLNPEKSEQKERQLKRTKEWNKGTIDDILLVTIPIKDLQETYAQWKKTKSPGGPEMLWSKDTKQEILQGILNNILPKDEIDSLLKEFEANDPQAA